MTDTTKKSVHLGDMFFSTEIIIKSYGAPEISHKERLAQLSKQFNCPYLGQEKFIFWKKDKTPVVQLPSSQKSEGQMIELNDGYRLESWVLEKNKNHNFLMSYPLAEALCLAEELGAYIREKKLSGDFQILVNDVLWFNEANYPGGQGEYKEYSLLIRYDGESLSGHQRGGNRSAFSRYVMCKPLS